MVLISICNNSVFLCLLFLVFVISSMFTFSHAFIFYRHQVGGHLPAASNEEQL